MRSLNPAEIGPLKGAAVRSRAGATGADLRLPPAA